MGRTKLEIDRGRRTRVVDHRERSESTARIESGLHALRGLVERKGARHAHEPEDAA